MSNKYHISEIMKIDYDGNELIAQIQNEESEISLLQDATIYQVLLIDNIEINSLDHIKP